MTGYLLLVVGLGLWSLPHLWKRLAPEHRESFGDTGKAFVAISVLLSLVAMTYGYKWAPFTPVWNPPAFFVHINNLLMIFSVFLFFAGKVPGNLRTKMRHPMLIGFKTWAFAHLLVNGDLASIILFGGLLAWAVVEVIQINKAGRDWERPPAGSAMVDAGWFVGAIVATVVIGYIHSWLGVWPFAA